MRKLLAAIGFCFALLATPASAQVIYSTACCTTGATTGTCCYVTSSGDTASTVAKWAVELQLRNWLGKKPEDLTRADIKTDRIKLDALCKWAKDDVENKVFSQAYLNWAEGIKSALNEQQTKLDHDEIASALLLHGLPSLPDAAK